MAIEEIERLKEKLSKDPNSKLFVPLAEEYKKAGMYDEAVDVLTQGLERQPGYLSARVSLGKIFIERSKLDEAKAEFEKVIAVIPDNLYAHKKLAEIYKELGEKEKAAKAFKTVLQLNPLDEWAATSLSAIETEPVIQPQELTEEPVHQSIPPEEKILPAEEKHEKTIGMPFTEKDFQQSVPVAEAEEEKEKSPEITMSEEDTDLWEMPSEISGEKEAEVEAEKAPEVSISEEDIELWVPPPEATQEVREEVPVPISDEDIALWKAHTETLKEERGRGGEEEIAEAVFESSDLPDEELISFESILKEPEPFVEENVKVMKEKVPSQQPALTFMDADQYINQGKYMEAMAVYKNILSREPSNNQALQRVEELRALLKLLGKDKEELITKLETFLETIKKKRNEFFGSS